VNREVTAVLGGDPDRLAGRVEPSAEGFLTDDMRHMGRQRTDQVEMRRRGRGDVHDCRARGPDHIERIVIGGKARIGIAHFHRPSGIVFAEPDEGDVLHPVPCIEVKAPEITRPDHRNRGKLRHRRGPAHPSPP